MARAKAAQAANAEPLADGSAQVREGAETVVETAEQVASDGEVSPVIVAESEQPTPVVEPAVSPVVEEVQAELAERREIFEAVRPDGVVVIVDRNIDTGEQTVTEK